MVAEIEAPILAPGDSAKILLKIQTSQNYMGQYAKLLSFTTEDEDVIALEVVAEVVPFVSCKSLVLDKEMIKPGQLVFSFLRKEAPASNFRFEPPSTSCFEWHVVSSTFDELTISIVPIARDKSLSVLAEEWQESCRFVSRDLSTEVKDVFVPVLFSLPRKPRILPSKLVILDDNVVSFCVVGDFEADDINAKTMQLICNEQSVEFVCRTRSKRVHEVKASLGKVVTPLQRYPKDLRIVFSPPHVPGLDVVLPITDREPGSQ
jgi:hypothetical protein